MSEGDPDKAAKGTKPAKSRRGRPATRAEAKVGVTAAPPPPPKKARWAPHPREIRVAWEEAQAVWGVEVNLTPPATLDAAAPDADWGGDEPLAYIDMKVRQVVVNFAQLDEIGARKSLVAVLAHELGHHVRYPHTLGLAAQLRILETRLIPGLPSSLTNLFFDLQVNEEVGRSRSTELCAVYRGFVARDPDVSPLFWFYLAIYEELWSLAPGTLAPAAQADAMEGTFPGCRAEARMFAQTFWALGDVYLMFIFFASAFIRYVPRPDEKENKGDKKMPLGHDVPEPTLDDWASGMYGNPAAERALEEARRRGWIGAGQASDLPPEPLGAVTRIFGAPGSQNLELREALVSRFYRRLVEQHLIRLPALDSRPEPLVPTTHSEWERGDDPRLIDWTASVLAAGPLAALRPLRRDFDDEPPVSLEGGAIGVEIYLDTSGSMPDPRGALNAMTLAAQILAASAIRKGGRARGVVYSSNFVESPWFRDEERARRFLLTYAGGGTRYPWAVLDRLSRDTPAAVRIIISDSDFLANLKEKGAQESFAAAVARSKRVVLLLALPEAGREHVRAAVGDPTWRLPQLRVALVPDLGKFGQMAADLARALFGGGPASRTGGA